jgi:hypothetical protein
VVAKPVFFSFFLGGGGCFEIYEEPYYSKDASLSVCLSVCAKSYLIADHYLVYACLKLRGLNGAGFVPVACAVEPDR